MVWVWNSFEPFFRFEPQLLAYFPDPWVAPIAMMYNSPAMVELQATE
jgi:hypothetical protein